MIEALGKLLASLILPLSSLLAEKLADRFGPSDAPLRRIVVQSIAFGLLFFPVVILTVCALGAIFFAFQWLLNVRPV